MLGAHHLPQDSRRWLPIVLRWIAGVAILAVMLHFLPLAWILRAPRYYTMGAAIVLCVLASLLVPEGSVRNVIACAGIGLPMWITAAVILSARVQAIP